MTSALITHAETWVASQPLQHLNLYAIVDAAQDKRLWQQLASYTQSAPILPSGAEELSPHLLLLGEADALPVKVVSLLSRPYLPAAVTLLYSPLKLSELQAHLRKFAKVNLPGNFEMILAFWDPSILGTLLSQIDDETLHVKGPVLTESQLHAFLQPIPAWWYSDREGGSHLISSSAETALPDSSDISECTLNQTQEDALVEASVPDQVLYHLELNRPTLFDEKLPHAKRYRFIRAVLPSAHQLGLNGMRDMTNFVALCLIYRQRIETDPQILQLLDQVRKQEMTLDEALEYMPE